MSNGFLECAYTKTSASVEYMKITYTPSFVDALRATVHVLSKIKVLFFSLVVSLFIVRIYSLFEINGFASPADLLLLILAVLLVAFLVAAAFTGVVTFLSLNSAKKYGTHCAIAFNQEGLVVENGSNSVLHQWQSINRVDETGHAFYFYMKKRPVAFLPKRAIGSMSELDAVRNLVRTRATLPQAR